jgi:hypothetical protein
MCRKKCKKGIENAKNVSITLSSSKHMRMIPFNLQFEIANRLTTIFVEQLDQLADTLGFMRYQIRSFHQSSVVHVNIENEPTTPEEIIGYSIDDAFSPDEIEAISAAIKAYNRDRKLSFDQMSFNF